MTTLEDLAWLVEAVTFAPRVRVTIEDFANQRVAYDLAYELSLRSHPVGSAVAAILKRSFRLR